MKHEHDAHSPAAPPAAATTTTPAYPEGEWFGASETARRLRLTTQHLLRLIQRGQLPYQQTALGRLFSAAAVERLRLEREQRKADAAAKREGKED